MFDFNVLGRAEPFNMYLCTPSGKALHQLNGIDEDTASISANLNNQYSLSFDYYRHINADDGSIVESNGYHSLVIGMKVLVEGIGYFTLKYPPMKFDGNREGKTVNAVSIDGEFEDKDLVGFKINTGESDSLECLVSYDDNETESLTNDYTGLPYDYIVFYNTFPEQLAAISGKYADGTYSNSSAISEIKSFCDLIPRLKRKATKNSDGSLSIEDYVTFAYDPSGENITSIHLSGFNSRVSQLIAFYGKYRDQLGLVSLAIEKCKHSWKIGHVDEALCNKKFQFDIDGKNIYSFFTDDVSSAAKCVFQFDILNREVNVVLAESIGTNSGVVLDRHGLLNALDVTCSSDNIYTRYNVSGGNGIDIKYVNFGRTQITDLSYFINARDVDNKRIYVTDGLAAKYGQYLKDIELARGRYIESTKEYNRLLIEINDLKYRVPNDSVKNNWDTFTDEELDASLKGYNQLLATLQSLYKEDYGAAGCNADGSINEPYIRNTEYWHDYYAYKVTIGQIEQAMIAKANNQKYEDAKKDEDVAEIVNAWETEWSLFGTVELENKVAAYTNRIQSIADAGAVVVNHSVAWEGNPGWHPAMQWKDLDASQKGLYGNIESVYQYGAYMKLYDERGSCQKYLDSLNSALGTLEQQKKQAQSRRDGIAKWTDIDTYDREKLYDAMGMEPNDPTMPGSFTDEEKRTLSLLCIDKNYSNENILTTSLDTIVSEIDAQHELLEDAKEQLSIESQPQISFNADIENILAMPEFDGFEFKAGNFVTLEYYDDYYVDMRLTSMTFNPCIPERPLTVSFSNFINSKSERTDVSNILGLAIGNNSGSSSGSSGGSGSNPGKFGEGKDIDITVSNTMLSKLLNTEMFGTRVSNIILDTIKANEITAKYAEFDGLAKGRTVVDGKCLITGYIRDNAYNGAGGNIDNSKGTVINLETGKFSFGGGKIKFDGEDLTFDQSVRLSWSQVTGTGNVANKNDIPTDDYITNITKNTVTSTYIKGLNLEVGNQISMGSNAVISWSQVTGTGNVASKNDVNEVKNLIPTDIKDLEDLEGQKWSTEIGNTWIQTANVIAQNLKVGSANITGQLTAGQINTTGLIAENISGTTITGKTISGGTISIGNNFSVDAAGNLTAKSGNVGNWNIGANGMSYTTPSYTVTVAPGTNGVKDFLVVHDKSSNTYPFSVRADGSLTATKANITGVITATSGTFNNAVINDKLIFQNTSNSDTTAVIEIAPYNYFDPNISSLESCFKITADTVRIVGHLDVSSLSVRSYAVFNQEVNCGNKLTVAKNIVCTENNKGLYGTHTNGNPLRLAIATTNNALVGGDKVNCTIYGDPDVRTYLTGASIHSTVNITQHSDMRLKENFAQLDSRYLAMFDSMEQEMFTWKIRRDDSRKQVGYVAQRVLKAMEDAGIPKDENTIIGRHDDIDNPGYGEILSLDYNGLSVIAAYALKDTRQTVKKHGSDIKELKEKVSELIQYIGQL